jgi:hypothetical protein
VLDLTITLKHGSVLKHLAAMKSRSNPGSAKKMEQLFNKDAPLHVGDVFELTSLPRRARKRTVAQEIKRAEKKGLKLIPIELVIPAADKISDEYLRMLGSGSVRFMHKPVAGCNMDQMQIGVTYLDKKSFWIFDADEKSVIDKEDVLLFLRK